MVRPFNHAGPRQSSRYVLAGFALQIAEVECHRRTCLNVGNLSIVRDFTDVRDVVRAYRLLGQQGQPGEIYNLGSGQGTKLIDALNISALGQRVQLMCKSTRAVYAQSTSHCLWPTQANYVQQLAGNHVTQSSKPWLICLILAVALWLINFCVCRP